MKLIKILLIEFEDRISNLKSLDYNKRSIYSRINNSVSINGKESNILITEKKGIEYLIEKDNITISISNNIIKEIEEVAEEFINFISLSKNTGRKISASKPSIFLEPENNLDIMNLSIARNMKFENISNIASARTDFKFDLDFCKENLQDRIDGVQILAEANSTNHLSGKFHEYIRFFERAFKRENSGLTEPLSKFLSSNKNLGYSKKEIEKWINDRNRSVHANDKSGYLIERDVIKFIDRIEQASYDILFNKLEWGNKSIRRRNLFKFREGTDSDMNNLFIPPSTTSNIMMSFLDETKSYPQNISFEVYKSIPKNWWYQKDIQSVFNDFFKIKTVD